VNPRDVPAATALVKDILQGPRESGTPEAVEARERIARFLTGLGYEVETQRFSFRTSALLGFPVFGAGLGWLTLLEIPLLVLPGAPAWAALLVWSSGLLSLGVVAAGLSLGWATLGGEAREDANLVATRGDQVTRWIVAHYDTKAQGHSMAGRLVAVWVLVLACLGMTALAAARLWEPLSTTLMAAGAALNLAGGALATRGRLKGKSSGARDNGTGLLAALVVAQENRDPGVGILVTGAEEFGLIGARYFAERCPGLLQGATVINFDTLDDQGAWRLVSHRDDAAPLVDGLAASVSALSPLPVRRHRMTAGIFVDSYPLARAGAQAVTLARLDWGTLRRLHTPGDRLEGLTLDSAVLGGAAAARFLAAEALPSGRK
jgi:hypothetical protein